MKTLIDMQNDFDKVIDSLMNAENARVKEDALETASALAKITKQKINSMALIVKGDKMCGRTDRVTAIVGEFEGKE